MIRNRFLNYGSLSIITLVIVIAMSASYELVYAESNTGDEVVLNVEGMTCGACENAVKSQLLKVAGVKDASADCKNGKAVVKVEEGKANTDELIKAVEKAGFSASKS